MRLTSPLLPRTLPGTDVSSTTNTAMVILNTPMTKPPSLIFQTLWESSSFHICADGGANRLYHATINDDENDNMNEKDHKHNAYIPSAIRGDLDSLQPHVRDYYASKNVLIEQDPCQDTNDLDKALQKIVNHPSLLSSSVGDSPPTVVIYGAFGGRFDQEMASFQALYKWADAFHHRLWLYSDETSAVLIPAGPLVEIQIPHQLPNDSTSTWVREGPTCGLIPLGSKVDSITTTGLQWNLEQAATEFGGLVSTSNHILNEVVTVQTSHPIIFTAEVTTTTRTNTR